MQKEINRTWFENQLHVFIPNMENPFLNKYNEIIKLYSDKIKNDEHIYKHDKSKLKQLIEEVALEYVERYGDKYCIDKSIITKSLINEVCERLLNDIYGYNS